MLRIEHEGHLHSFTPIEADTLSTYATDLGAAVLLFVIFVASFDLGIAFLYRAAAGAAGDGESFRD